MYEIGIVEVYVEIWEVVDGLFLVDYVIGVVVEDDYDEV